MTGAVVGGTAPGAGNLIEGIWIGSDSGTTTNGYNSIRGNLIGTDVTGKRVIPIGDNYGGITIKNSLSNVIGGSAPGAGNVIASAGHVAVYLGADNSATVLGTVVEGNHIGTDLTGTVNLGDAPGVACSSSGNAIGDVVPGAGNVIANSTTVGVQINDAASTGNKILGNSIYANASGGIALASSTGVTRATITAAYPVATGLLIQGGTFTGGAAGTGYTVEFFSNPGLDASGQAEGQTYLGRITVITNANGAGSFRWLLPVSVKPGQVLSSTVTGPTGNTTAFSQGVVVSPQPTDVSDVDGLPLLDDRRPAGHVDLDGGFVGTGRRGGDRRRDVPRRRRDSGNGDARRQRQGGLHDDVVEGRPPDLGDLRGRFDRYRGGFFGGFRHDDLRTGRGRRRGTATRTVGQRNPPRWANSVGCFGN